MISRSLSIFSLKISDQEVLLGKKWKNIDVKRVPLPFSVYCFFMGLFSLLAFLSLLRLVRHLEVSERETAVLHSQDMNFAAVAVVLAGKVMNMPTVLHQHGPYINMLPTGTSRAIEENFNRFSARFCDKIIVTDRFTQNYVARFSERKKIVVIPAAVDSRFFEDLNQGTETDRVSYTIGYIGRLSPEKNIPTLIVAFKKLTATFDHPCRLLIVGDGESRVELEKMVSNLGLNDDVKFFGFQANIVPYLSTFDIFVLPSKTEGTPISLLEAMSAGKAIVASGIPAICEIVANRKEAILFDSTSPSQLCSSIKMLLRNASLRAELGKNARKKVKAYDTEVVFSKILQLYLQQETELRHRKSLTDPLPNFGFILCSKNMKKNDERLLPSSEKISECFLAFKKFRSTSTSKCKLNTVGDGNLVSKIENFIKSE